MRKFKHKITGDLVHSANEHYTNGVHTIHKIFVENSNDWEEIKEYPKIVAFKGDANNIAKLNNEGTYTYNSNGVDFTKEKLLENKCVTIYQVAKSENEIFTVGDKVQHIERSKDRSLKDVGKIKLFKKEGDSIIAFYGESDSIVSREGCFWNSIECIEKTKDPLFITEDKIEMHEGMCCWEVARAGKIYDKINKFTPLERCKNTYNDKTWITFSTEQLAQKYIDDNKLRFSKKDVEEALKELKSKAYVYWDDILKQKLGI